MTNQEKNELLDSILSYLNSLRGMAASNKRNNAYIKGVRDSMKLVQAFKEVSVEDAKSTETAPAEENDETKEAE